MSNVLQNDVIQATLSSIFAITTSTGVYLFSSDITSRTLVNSNPFARVCYGNKYVAIDSSGLIYTSVDGIYFALQSSNFNTLISTTYTAPFIIRDSSKYSCRVQCIR